MDINEITTHLISNSTTLRRRAMRATSHLLEVLVIALTLIVSISSGMPTMELVAHFSFVCSTMSLLLCVHAVRTYSERVDTLQSILFAMFERRIKDNYDIPSRLDAMKAELRLMMTSSSIVVAAWMVCVIFYAKSISEHQSYRAQLGACAGVTITIAMWQVFATSKNPPILDVENIARIFSDDSVGGDVIRD